MTAFIIVAGISCIAYAYWNKRQLNNFKDIFDIETRDLNDREDNLLYEKAYLSDVESLKVQCGAMEKELAELRESEKSTKNRLAAMERIFEEFTGIRSKGQSSLVCDDLRFKEMIAGRYDFEDKSLEELSSETGLKKGELLLLKRLSKK